MFLPKGTRYCYVLTYVNTVLLSSYLQEHGSVVLTYRKTVLLCSHLQEHGTVMFLLAGTRYCYVRTYRNRVLLCSYLQEHARYCVLTYRNTVLLCSYLQEHGTIMFLRTGTRYCYVLTYRNTVLLCSHLQEHRMQGNISGLYHTRCKTNCYDDDLSFANT